jgi:plastocyanin
MKRWSVIAVPMLALGAVAFARPGSHATPPTTHVVRMMQQGAKYRFEPADFTIKVGDIVEFENISGGPHNVVFDKDHIPAGAREALNRDMPQRQGDLMGPFLTQPHQKYSITFSDAPKGTYGYYCLPHRALGMVGVITVE